MLGSPNERKALRWWLVEEVLALIVDSKERKALLAKELHEKLHCQARIESGSEALKCRPTAA
jgi:hypothetical protein